MTKCTTPKYLKTLFIYKIIFNKFLAEQDNDKQIFCEIKLHMLLMVLKMIFKLL